MEVVAAAWSGHASRSRLGTERIVRPVASRNPRATLETNHRSWVTPRGFALPFSRTLMIVRLGPG